MAKVIITTNNKYAKYLSKHLQEEHPKTKGKIIIYTGMEAYTYDKKMKGYKRNPQYDR